MIEMRCLLILALFATTNPAVAQSRQQPNDDDWQEQEQQQQQQQQQAQATSAPTQPGRIAESAVGIVGQRQTREQVASDASPMARIENRIANRVQSRIRNRIDRDYDPQANATSPFTTAEERTRKAGRR